jgi:hypothetical protein
LIEMGVAKRQLPWRTVLHKITFTVKCLSIELNFNGVKKIKELWQKSGKIFIKFH